MVAATWPVLARKPLGKRGSWRCNSSSYHHHPWVIACASRGPTVLPTPYIASRTEHLFHNLSSSRFSPPQPPLPTPSEMEEFLTFPNPRLPSTLPVPDSLL